MPIDYAGNTLGTARGLNITPTTQTFTDWVGSLDTNDYYRFSLSSRSSFNLSLNGMSADADVRLLNSSGMTIGSSTCGGSLAESINSILDSGTYYIRVYPFSGSTNYNLNVSATAIADYAGNSMATARNINLTSSNTTYSDWVGSVDTNDYYRFTLGSASNFNLSLNGMSADADVQLLNSSGYIVQSSTSSGASSESIARSLNAGTYYIRVYPYGSNTNYNLNVSATAIADYAGNSMATARNISLSSSNTTYRDWVGSVDTNDYYRFTLASTSNFNLSLNGMSADADVQLLNSSGSVIQSSTYAGASSESITRSLNAGTYYIRVYPYSGSTNYNLNLSAASITPTPTPTPTPPPSSTANWTFMVYMAGHNLESFGVQDFQEMAAIGSNANINIVSQFDRTAGYTSAYSDWTDTRRGRILGGDTPSLNWGTSIGEANMGDANTLRDFVNWSMTNYRANNYALILWGHGSGFSVSYDDITGDSISASELSSVLGGLSSSVSLVGADACLMGNVEFAYQIRNYASVYVGSQEVEPGQGWEYTSILSGLRANPNMTSAQLGSRIVDTYGQYYGVGSDTTLSAINLATLRSNTLASTLNQFASTVMNSSTAYDRQRLSTHVNNATSFYDPNFRDIGSVLSQITNDATMSANIRTAAQSVLSAYNSTIISNFSAVNPNSTGLSIYFQPAGYNIPGNYNSTNFTFAANTVWDEFLNWWAGA